MSRARTDADTATESTNDRIGSAKPKLSIKRRRFRHDPRPPRKYLQPAWAALATNNALASTSSPVSSESDKTS